MWVGLSSCLCPREKRRSEAVKAKPRKRIRSVSKARTIRLAEYAKVKEQWMGAMERTVVTWMGREAFTMLRCDCCKNPKQKTDVHHTRGRAGKLLCATEHWMLVCRECHRWIHANPDEARKRGWLAQRGEWGKL